MVSPSWQYDVALSYAGEDRAQARELAMRIHKAGYSVFYDEFVELWGEDLSVKLHDVYEKQSHFCVILVSRHYLRKPWTNNERQHVLARAMRQDTVYLLPIRLDDSELPGLAGVIAFKDLRRHSMEDIFESLKKILGPPPPALEQLVKRRPEDTIIRVHPRNFLCVVVQKDNVETPWFNLDCHLINESRKPGRLQRLEVMVTPSSKRGIQFMWNLFYEYLPGGQIQVKSADAGPLELGPEESRLLGVQFIGPRLDWKLMWPPGEYEFDILGWVNRQPREPEADLRTRFQAKISPWESQELNRWADALDSAWKRLNDPHNAVGIPVTIDKSTLVVG
jgi:TIR domain